MRNCIVTLLLWELFFFCGIAWAQEPPALTLKKPIALTKVEGRMDHLGVDVKGERLFATAFDNHTLEVIDLKTGRQVHTIPNLNEPQGSFYDPATNRLFEANGGDGTVKILTAPHFSSCKP
jgi:DNA-binding beta-propeller fold protein YncE